jgi:metallo-beta-lactamase family protein
MKITFHGAAREVTGSQHLIEVNGRLILLDCGLMQGKRLEAYERNRQFPFDPSKIDIMILSHAHTDHAGNIPSLVKQGFRGDIYCTFATQDLCGAMLLDSAHIQETDAKFMAKRHERNAEIPKLPIKPLYTTEDAVKALRYFHAVGYGRTIQIMPDVSLTFSDAGHMLGSAIVTLNIDDKDLRREITLVFSGDLGSPGMPILRDPTLIDRADVLIMESTYGDRDHDSHMDGEKMLRQIVNETHKRGGKIIIPSFAVGRTQELVYTLHKLSAENAIPNLPIYVDSPLAVNVTAVFSNHPEAYDEETREFISGSKASQDPFGFDGLRYTRSVDDSKAINSLQGPAIIISASGMAESGRILHHLRNNISDPRNTILIVGFQAEHTLGRKIEEGQSPVRIFGEAHDVRAQVKRITGFSAHADRTHLLEWAGSIEKKPMQTFLVHGEDGPLEALAQALRKQIGFEVVHVPNLHQSFQI